MTGVVFGAYATQMLGDLGADVIKVEFPGGRRGGGGDIMRWTGDMPEAPAGPRAHLHDHQPHKRSALLDLREEKAARALKRLIKTCDVFAVTVRYEGLKRLGLELRGGQGAQPDVIYVHGSGYGSDGPYAGEPAYERPDSVGPRAWRTSCRTDGNPEPRLFPSLIADKVSGHFMTQAILAALFHHARTGEASSSRRRCSSA